MESPAPTPQNLYARLRAKYPHLSEEKLARELDLNTVSTLTDMKKGIGPRWDTTIRLLSMAGWICTNGGSDERSTAARQEQLLARAEAALRELQQPEPPTPPRLVPDE